MATVSRGYTFSTNEAPTAQKLNDLVDNGDVSGVVASDLVANTYFVNAAQPGSPSQGDNGLDSDHHITFYDGSSWNKTSGRLRLVNKRGSSVSAYAPVVPYKGGFTVTQASSGTADTSVVGVLTTTTADGVSGLIVTSGLGLVSVLPHTTASFSPGDFVACGDTDNPEQAIPILRTQVDNPLTLNYEVAGFGILLEAVAADAAQTPVNKYCMIFK